MNHFMRRAGGFSLLLAGGLTYAAAAQMRTADAGAVPGIIPSGFGESVDRDVARVRAATAQFKMVDKAIAAGYPRHTDCVENQPQGAMGFHFQNNALLDATLDVERPEVLVYEKMPDGTFKLNGVEYLRADSRMDERRGADHHGTETEARREAGNLVPPRLDLGAEPVGHLRRLESTREVLIVSGRPSVERCQEP